ncbi:ankyrin repeat-containing domain protein, partial [Pseudomassariella vexata]
LYNAAKSGDVQTLRRLLIQEVSPEFTNIEGETPLWIAAAEGHRDIVELFIKAGADLNFQDENGQTAVSIARENGHEGVVRILEQSTMRLEGTAKYRATKPRPKTRSNHHRRRKKKSFFWPSYKSLCTRDVRL